ncbi:FG-GAP repeat protein [uncultured Thiodictyon sp.]|uniref:FG-GAP repeat protein n=1 Tax=uncultured Thiodictyon sp. TaxID=1846217 RepID=UPI0025E1437B|nr:FG-GAP repeat protein [uncultured Thiodictyon sp.]
MHRFLSALVLLLGLATAPLCLPTSESTSPPPRGQQPTDPNTPPQGLNAAEWADIRGQVAAHRYAAVPTPGGHQAANPGQQWCTQFDGRGFLVEPQGADWRWGLELRGYGVGGALPALTDPVRTDAAGSRIAYDWDERLQEWFVNDQRGLEHGFTLRTRPGGEGDALDLAFAVRGGLRPDVAADGQAVRFLDAQGASVLTYGGLKVTDADGAVIAAGFTAEPDGLRLRVTDAGARYPLTIDPLAQQAYLKASNTQAFDHFGWSVAVAGDTVVVGAKYESSNATGVNGNQADNSAVYAGAAYVFVRSGTTWTQQAYLKASNAEASDDFGWSVAVAGDTVVVGAPFESSGVTGVDGNQADNSAAGAGAAYVFVRSGTTWAQQAYLKASNTEANDTFGWAVAVSGDTVVVGAGRESSNATGVDGDQFNNSAAYSGAAYVFVRSGTTWGQQAYLKASNTEWQDAFGESLAISGDTVVVGAFGEDSNAAAVNGNQADNTAASAGAAYVFVRSGTVWTQQAYLKASNTQANDAFGVSVAASGDTVVVGA